MRALLARWRGIGREFNAEFGVTLHYRARDIAVRAFVIAFIAVDVLILAAAVPS